MRRVMIFLYPATHRTTCARVRMVQRMRMIVDLSVLFVSQLHLIHSIPLFDDSWRTEDRIYPTLPIQIPIFDAS